MSSVPAARALGGSEVILEGEAVRPLARILLVVGFALLTFAGAKIRIPLPFTQVPATLQTLPVLLAGALLGARAGAASQALYVGLGIAGLPVFALPGAGPGYLLGPTGGFLVGFVVAAFVTGHLRRLVRPLGSAGAFLALLCGSVALYLCGLSWLALVLGGDAGAAIRAGLQPFLLFDLSKIVVATGIDAAWTRVALKRAQACRSGTPA